MKEDKVIEPSRLKQRETMKKKYGENYWKEFSKKGAEARWGKKDKKKGDK